MSDFPSDWMVLVPRAIVWSVVVTTLPVAIWKLSSANQQLEHLGVEMVEQRILFEQQLAIQEARLREAIVSHDAKPAHSDINVRVTRIETILESEGR